MLSLSTSWNSAKHTSGIYLIEEIKRIGFDTVELNFALTENMVKDVLSLVESGRIKVSSLHNICPLPKEVEPDEASPDYYSLASPDEKERELAVEVTKNTVNYAKRLGAKAVVLHVGRVQIKDRTKDLVGLIDDKERFEKLRGDMMRERNEKKDGYLDNVIKSLGALVGYARDMNVCLAIENRYYYREIPITEELEAIFQNFREGELYYWHDVGHAEVFDRLGLASHKTILDKFSSRLIGMHLHDIIGLINDHKPPGLGTFDFRMVKPYIQEGTIRVLEVHQPATADQIRKSARYLAKILEE